VKKIAFLIGSIKQSGGTERVTTLIANELAKGNYDVSILSLWDGDQSFFVLDSKINVASLFPQQISMRKNFFSAVSKIRQFCINNKIDTLIVVDSISCVFTVPALLGLNIKHICWEHFNLKVNLGSKFRDLGRWMAAKWCDKIVTLTERDKIFWVNKYSNIEQKIVVIPNPSLNQNLDNQPRLESKNVLAIGYLSYIKGFDLLLEAWSLVCKQVKEPWVLNIVGCGDEEDSLKKLAETLKISSNVIFWGQQKDVDSFYRKASIYCLSSRNEGFPMVLLEAQSYGLPIVAFDCDTGPAEIVVEGTGYLVKSSDIRSFSNQILRLIKMDQLEYERMCQLSKKNNQIFYLDKIVQKWTSKIINYK
jgi:glycosyltransferase involved in cell wall biosynthesis